MNQPVGIDRLIWLHRNYLQTQAAFWKEGEIYKAHMGQIGMPSGYGQPFSQPTMGQPAQTYGHWPAGGQRLFIMVSRFSQVELPGPHPQAHMQPPMPAGILCYGILLDEDGLVYRSNQLLNPVRVSDGMELNVQHQRQRQELL
jgi:hypothetical protein